MKDNPFAFVFREAFYKDVLQGSIYTPKHNIDYPKRVKDFMRHLNRFISKAGAQPIMYPKYAFDEHKLFEYALFLRGYMRDSQNVLASLDQKYAVDKDLIDLFKSSSEYVVECNGKVGDKREFDNAVGYKIWKTDISKGLENAKYEILQTDISVKRHNLFLFMPFRIKSSEEMIHKWVHDNMRQSLDNAVFRNNVDIYVIHYPIQKSRSSNITSVLKTLRFNDTFYEKEDIALLKAHWLPFVAQNIKLNNQGKVISADRYSPQELNENFRNITIFSYCAGTANAHRCLNVLYDITRQIYGEETATAAMSNIFVNSYGFLPVKDKLRYSGVHFYTNTPEDNGRREPFVNLNNHSLYEKTKVADKASMARLSILPDGRNYILAFRLSPKLAFIQNKQIYELEDGEYGHNMANISAINLYDEANYAHNVFKNILANSSVGKRGKDVLKLSTQNSSDNILIHSLIRAKLQKL